MSWWAWALVGVTGGGGAIARFLFDAAISAHAGRQFPLGTLAVNASGALALGLLTGLAARGTVETLAGAATLGSYTTFSTWMLETHRLTEDGELRRAALNIAVSLALGVAAAALGRVIGSGHV
jgi:CrcB protein